MYIGHFAVGFGGKKVAPRTSLGTLLISANLLDLIWPILVLLGIERVAIEPGTRARDRIGKYGLWGLAALLVLTYIGNLSGSPPPSVTALAVVGLALWLPVAWGYWVDRHRDAR
jgi:hypothetical protein